MMKRINYLIITLILLGIEVLIGLFAGGWVRSYLGDVLVVILLYTLCRTISPEKPEKWWILPTAVLIFAFIVEFLQLWGLCDRLGIENGFLRTIIGTGFSVVDLLCYCIGIIPCYFTELFIWSRNNILDR